MQVRRVDRGGDPAFGVLELAISGRSIGKLGLCVNEQSKALMSLPNFYKSKKIRMGSLWNDLAWFCNVFQVGEV